jgi:hypothetical protein
MSMHAVIIEKYFNGEITLKSTFKAAQWTTSDTIRYATVVVK